MEGQGPEAYSGVQVQSARIRSAERVEAATMPYTTFTPCVLGDPSSSSSSDADTTGPDPHRQPYSSSPANTSSSTAASAATATYTVYLLDVRCAVGRETFVVATFRRYSEFRALDAQLAAARGTRVQAPLTALLPPRRALGHLSADVVRARVAGLQRYLDALLRDPAAARAPAVLAFLCPVAERRRAAAALLLQDRVSFVLHSAQPPPPRARPLCLSLDAAQPQGCTLASLPEGLLLRVLAPLGVRDLLAVARTCRRLYVVASQNALWAPLLARVCPAWPAAVVDAPALDVRTSSKRALLRMCRACAPRRRAFQPRAQCLRCACPLHRMLAVLAGPAAPALFRALGARDTAAAQNPADAAFHRETATTCVHAEGTPSSWCFHIHVAPSSSSSCCSSSSSTATSTTVVGGESNHERLTGYFLLRSNFVVAAFHTDDAASLRAVPALVARVRALCPRMPVFLVGIPSSPTASLQKQQDEQQRRESRRRALEMGIALRAVKYIELATVDATSATMLLSEIGSVLSPALAEAPHRAVAPPPSLLTDEQSLVDVDDDEGDIEELAAASPEATSSAAAGSVGDPQNRRTAQAVVRGAREHFLRQLERLSIDGVVREYEASGLDLETKAANLKLFVASMADYVHGTALWRGASAREKTLAAHELEEYVFERLYAALFRPPQDRAADQAVEQQISRLGFVLPAHLDIPARFWDSDAWAAAADELQNMNYCASPFGKMHCLMNCTKILLHSLQSRATRGETSADHFLPHLVYVLIRANPPFLASNIAFVQRFASDSVRTSEASYYWTSLEVAVSFILQITSRSLRISEADYARLTSSTVVPLPPARVAASLDALPPKALRSLGLAHAGPTLADAAATAARAIPSRHSRHITESTSSSSTSSSSEDEDEAALTTFYRQRAMTRRASVAAGTLDAAAAAAAAAGQFRVALRGTQTPADADTLPLLDFDDDDEDDEGTTTTTTTRTRPRSDAVGTRFNLSTESRARPAPTPADDNDDCDNALEGMPAKPQGAAPVPSVRDTPL